VRTVHPIAWWCWAMGLAIVSTRATNALATGVLIAVTTLVVLLCGRPSPWARVFRAYLILSAAIVAVRVVFYVLVGIKTSTNPILPLPRIPLPAWTGGIEFLGPVSLTELIGAASAGLSLAALVLCFGAAIALTDPKRALRSLPASLHLLGSSAVIAVTVAPQLMESWQRIRRAQGLRGARPSGVHAVRTTSMPVLEDALDRSLSLAASMDARGYARTDHAGNGVVVASMFTALFCAVIGTYALLERTTPSWLALPLLGVAAAAAAVGSAVASRHTRRTRYRPDPWTPTATLIAGCGLAAAVLVSVAPHLPAPAGSLPAVLPPIFLLCCGLGALPAVTGAVPR
jgi:energy-coupling factor transport system permease protein